MKKRMFISALTLTLPLPAAACGMGGLGAFLAIALLGVAMVPMGIGAQVMAFRRAMDDERGPFGISTLLALGADAALIYFAAAAGEHGAMVAGMALAASKLGLIVSRVAGGEAVA